MNERFIEALSNFVTRPPASEAALKKLWGFSLLLPDEYLNFLQVSNGAEGSFGEPHLELWTAEEIIPANEGYGVTELAPGLLFFGSDGHGTGYAFDTRRSYMPIVKAQLFALRLDTVEWCANTFTEFLEHVIRQSAELA